MTQPVVARTGEDAWQAWERAQAEYSASHRVFGVVLHRHGDTHFQKAPGGQLEVVTFGGWACREASRRDIRLLDEAIAGERFMVCIQTRRPAEAPLLRVYPPRRAGWSTKSLHPDVGGLGLISASVVR